MFPQVAPKFFKTRAEGPKDVGKEPVKAAPAAAATGKPDGEQKSAATLSAPVNYVITLNGQEHKVTVAPIQ
jgi:methylmalonyl-CoA carboxyltransferase 5S subunit